MDSKHLNKAEELITNWDILSDFEKSEGLRDIVFCKSYNKITKKNLSFLLRKTIRLMESGKYLSKNHFNGYAELVNYLNAKKLPREKK